MLKKKTISQPFLTRSTNLIWVYLFFSHQIGKVLKVDGPIAAVSFEPANEDGEVHDLWKSWFGHPSTFWIFQWNMFAIR
jgi:hypothetical protein